MNLKSIGSFLITIGLLAIGMDFVGYVPGILIWIYNWGETVAWVIKLVLVIVGALLFFLAPEQKENA